MELTSNGNSTSFTQLPLVFPMFNMGMYQFMPSSILPQMLPQEAEVKNGSEHEDKKQNIDDDVQCFKNFFSPMDTAKSIQKRNQNFQMIKFQNSDQEPDDVYNRRKKKVQDLINKQQQQLQTVLEMRRNQPSKFQAVIDFIRVFCNIKNSLPGLKTDYYSNKTFCAIKNASEVELKNATKAIKKMLDNVLNFSESEQNQAQTERKNARMIEFLITPRFLISKEKINRLAKDEQLQKNFQFLIVHECLGHYNNEANKKMPEEKQMKYVRQLLNKKQGRQKFKKICSINHGNKFLKAHGNVYYHLYDQSLEYLKYLESSLKKGKKYESIIKDLAKIPMQTQDTVGNSSLTENSSSSNIYSFKSFGECLNKMENSEKDESSVNEELLDQPSEISLGTMRKFKARKLMSMPTSEARPVSENRSFMVRKFNTLEIKVENIILVPPPQHAEI